MNRRYGIVSRVDRHAIGPSWDVFRDILDKGVGVNDSRPPIRIQRKVLRVQDPLCYGSVCRFGQAQRTFE